ncbi:MAG: hypothetical protein Q8O19_03250 [Rectinemataceae bacterium]|nr:hypothetical protein [Rectinemataceae bacterium]
MTCTITADLMEAYYHCPRKAFLIMAGEPNPIPHEYVRITAEQAADNRQAHSNRLAGDITTFESLTDMAAGREILSDAELITGDLYARYDFLMRTTEPSRRGSFVYEPVKVIGTYRASKADANGLAYQASFSVEYRGGFQQLVR